MRVAAVTGAAMERGLRERAMITGKIKKRWSGQ
jgi:hypothetical protein